MTGKIVNLRQARKQKLRNEASATADKNAAIHGLSKDQKTLTKGRNEKARRDLEAHKRSKD